MNPSPFVVICHKPFWTLVCVKPTKFIIRFNMLAGLSLFSFKDMT